MEKNDNQPLWDAKRLVREYVEMADLIKHYQGKPFDDITWSNQIRIKRIASVLRAFMGLKDNDVNPVDFIMSVFQGWHYEELFDNSPLQEEDQAKLMAMVKEAMDDDRHYEYLLSTFSKHRHDRDRIHMLDVFLEFRIATEKLRSHFSGLTEAGLGGILGYYAIQQLYMPNLLNSNEMIDDMIVLLLGDKFKQSFSEEELKSDYGYPKETDDELFEWECDNM